MSMGLDGKNLIRTVLQPSGLHNDGSSATYQRFSVAAGEHELLLEMSDDVRAAGPTHRQVAQISLKPAQVLVINFDTAGNRFIIE
ncbi:MAG: hypothetical protein OEZ10_05055 [Gammaproteobacteria bacterium]|nr:hypothetical protein [Gammaproteobacteria bacterium]